jgi:hypothetical protein
MNCYTYAFLREDRTPYYIGKGKDNRAYRRRYKGEVRAPKDKSRIIFLKQNLTEEEAFKHEIYMIAVFGRKDLGTGILRNKTNGGEGASGVVRSDEYRKNISKIQKEHHKNNPHKNPMFNADVKFKWEKIIQSDEYKNKQLQSSFKRIEVFVDDILYLSINDAVKKTGIKYWYFEEKIKHTNKIYSNEYDEWNKNKNSTKPLCLKIDGKEYDSFGEAIKITNISRTYIKKCIEKNISITKEGYEHYKKIHSPKKIEINGRTFNSLKEASKFTGHSTKYLKKNYLDKIPKKNIKVVIIEGIEYSSIREASRKTNLPRSFITKNYVQSQTTSRTDH